MSNDLEPEASGWDAIDAVFDELYGGIEPVHVGYIPGLAAGSGLQGCSAYRAADHWHYVTYGLTELWDKSEEADPEISGWGYEFTLRAPAEAGEDKPPQWPFNLLEQLAKTTNQGGSVYEVGHRIDVRRPITGEDGTALTALAITRDTELPELIDSPNGAFALLQVVGITADELARMKDTSTAAVLEDLAEGNPLLITDPARAK
ncbi:suppressor of fused domain protein [Actinospica sp. MGRD01-02]|uniref:Suppressor of fused domain protein n=1 Tax=Actinospica acidithermotolerans TaxID=2828514 RepID=A0A941EF82_9ACTN|nr:suppressor of fused domain protein [Actinospica acidithermotolerans]MBR7829323.1 suppressor of fused domain protein [Actinospica acidithermotolerans]